MAGKASSSWLPTRRWSCSSWSSSFSRSSLPARTSRARPRARLPRRRAPRTASTLRRRWPSTPARCEGAHARARAHARRLARCARLRGPAPRRRRAPAAWAPHRPRAAPRRAGAHAPRAHAPPRARAGRLVDHHQGQSVRHHQLCGGAPGRRNHPAQRGVRRPWQSARAPPPAAAPATRPARRRAAAPVPGVAAPRRRASAAHAARRGARRALATLASSRCDQTPLVRAAQQGLDQGLYGAAAPLARVRHHRRLSHRHAGARERQGQVSTSGTGLAPPRRWRTESGGAAGANCAPQQGRSAAWRTRASWTGEAQARCKAVRMCVRVWQ
jgi:hypothetical protein